MHVDLAETNQYSLRLCLRKAVDWTHRHIDWIGRSAHSSRLERGSLTSSMSEYITPLDQFIL